MVCTLKAAPLLTAYLAELVEDMSAALSEGKPLDEIWTETCTVMDLILRVSRCSVQSTGRSLGLAVVGQRNLWLSLSAMANKDKTNLDHPVSSEGLFGPAAFTAIQELFKALKKQQPAFKAMVPPVQSP